MLRIPWMPFIPRGAPIYGQTDVWGTRSREQRSLPRTGDSSDETSLRSQATAPRLRRHYSPIAAVSPEICSGKISRPKAGEALYLTVRNETERRAAPLTPEDQVIQSMPDASPAKWHRAHTTWFFEQFLLGEHCAGYQPFHPDYAFLFNSYYVSAGPRHARAQRGHLTRPGADEVTAYRAHVDAAVRDFFTSRRGRDVAISRR